MTHRVTAFAVVLLSMVAVSMCGCQAAGVFASAFPNKNKSIYKGLVGHSIGVMVWADRAALIDYPSIQLDLAEEIQNRLHNAKSELKGSTYPHFPASIVRFQKDHPETQTMTITDVAPQLGVDRLIYVEIGSFSTHAPESVEIFRGSATSSLKVLETHDGKAEIGYDEPDIKTTFPKNAAEGVLNGDDQKMYRGTVKSLAEQITDRFLSHDPESQSEDLGVSQAP